MTKRRERHSRGNSQSRAALTRRPPPAPADPRRRVLALAVGAVAIASLLTIDDRYPGAIADGRQMDWTAIAIAETGGIGQARGRDFTWPRADGDAVSRYGIAMSLAQVPAAWLAPRIERWLGPASSQPLFLVVPLLCVCAAAAASGWIAIGLGLGPASVAAAALLTALGSPLGSYAALDLSEPLQAAALTLALACALAASQPGVAAMRARRSAFFAGLAAGIAVLTKSSLWIATPFALLPLLSRESATAIRARILAAAAGLSAPVVCWIYFDLTRFGSVFASYEGERFSHSLLDGAWRLLVGPNRGLMLYFPALLLALAAIVRFDRASGDRRRLVLLGSGGILASLLVVASTWWAWHGLWGWGPRLLTPAIPALAACAAITLDRWRPVSGFSVVAISTIVNLPGLLQNSAPVTLFVANCRWPAADRAFAESLAGYARRLDSPGRYRVAPEQILERVPRASPFLVYPWFARAASQRKAADRARVLTAPPWVQVRPDITCSDGPPTLDRYLRRRPGWTIWGRGFEPDADAPGFPGVYDEGLLDQVVRAQQLGRADLALTLAEKLGRLAPSGEADARILESLRMLKRRADAVEYLSSLSRERRSEPSINVVLALFERDGGNEQLARGLLGTVVQFFPRTPVERAIEAPITEWPADLNAMTMTATDQAGPAR